VEYCTVGVAVGAFTISI